MRCVAGPTYRPGEGWVDGWLLHDGGRVVRAGEGAPPQRSDVEGWLLPAPVNAHTHVGDRVARGVDVSGLTLAQVVAPPDGLKHRILRETPAPRLVDGMRQALAEMEAAGARACVDFREGGLRGVEMLREAAAGSGARPVALGRCAGPFGEDEARRVLEACDGYGWSGLADAEGAERAAALCRRMGKRFALHFSEDKREDAGRALDLRPDFLVHAVRATEDDLRAIAAARVPVVLCPRSNLRFGPLPDVRAMARLGVALAVGSDNAMLQTLDVLEDVRTLRGRFPDVDPRVFLDAAVAGGRRILGAADDDWVALDADPLGGRPSRVVWRSWTKG
ncbi:MAG TPA: amidohydrolase family protein [Candidatus Thermoplasmatota archaeon]|nr:amidohydrolase family protein [Candidatus Thermoplasmatota archaeon]